MPRTTSRVAARIQLRLWYNQEARGCVRNVLIASHLDEDGEVAEWLKAPASKADVLERVPRVRISPSPPEQFPRVLSHPRYPCSISYLTSLHPVPYCPLFPLRMVLQASGGRQPVRGAPGPFAACGSMLPNPGKLIPGGNSSTLSGTLPPSPRSHGSGALLRRLWLTTLTIKVRETRAARFSPHSSP